MKKKYKAISQILKSAQSELMIVNNYVDESVLEMLNTIISEYLFIVALLICAVSVHAHHGFFLWALPELQNQH